MIDESRIHIEASSKPIYVLIDSRAGPIRDIGLQLKLTKITSHPNVAFAAVYGFDSLTNLFAGAFMRLNWKNNAGFSVC